jgi:serine/threonine-protein kinase
MMLSARPVKPGQRRPALVPGLSYRAGDLLAGRYRLVSLVRPGRACAHLLAIELAKNAIVGIQLFVPPSAASARDIESARFRFLNAASRSAALSSRSVARVLDAGLTSENLPFVVRESVPERTLASLLEERGSLQTHEAVKIARDVCEALADAHARGILHGEISPHVVHVGGEGPSRIVKLTDIGTAHAVASLPDTRGEPVLRAPEILASQRSVDARVDVWGVGALLHTMLAGAAPFGAATRSAVDLSVQQEEAPSLAGVPDALAEIVEACLSRDPAKRPSTIATLSASLAPYATPAMLVLADESGPTLAVGDPDSTAPQDAETRARLLDLLSQTSPLPVMMPPRTSAAKLDPVAAPPPRPRNARPEKTPSVPPVVLGSPWPRDEKTVLTPRKRGRFPLGRALAITASVAAALVVVVEAPNIAASLRRAPAAPAAAAATQLTAMPHETSVPAPTPTPVDVLPAAPATPSAAPSSRASAPRPYASGAHPKARATATALAPAPAAEPADPKPEIKEPKKAETKSDDDDLRKFLDDRR